MDSQWTQSPTGSFARHRPANSDMVLLDPHTGRPVSDPASLIAIIGDYTHKLYNRDDAPTDPSVLDDIDQRRTSVFATADPPSLTEFTDAIWTLANNKAPGASLVPAEAVKALPKRAKKLMLPMFKRFWHNDVPDGIYEEWQTAILKLLYKHKGSAKLLKNYRGIVLQDLFARIMSVICNKRLMTILKINGMEEQFGSQAGRGTIDANWVLRSLLHTRKDHGIDSHVLFVDLIKAFDTANHELLFALLAKYGAPAQLIDVIRRLHQDFQLEFKLDKKHQCTIDYTVGVRQGDNMAPVLFLFLMQAFAESTRKAWQTNRAIPHAHSPEPEETLIRGQLVNTPTANSGRVVELPFTLFVDDTAFIFDSREEMATHLPFLHKQFGRFGLLMHVGTVDPAASDPAKQLIPSKTECMFFPARHSALSKDDLVPERIFFGENNQLHVHYTDKFKYLGSRLVPLLSDEPEIRHRIEQATNQVNSLSNFWKSSAELRTKRMIYLQIPLNTALYGCEYWALNERTRRLLSGFHHKSMRKVLGIRPKARPGTENTQRICPQQTLRRRHP